MSKKWVGVFSTPEDVRETVDELKQQGFVTEQISVLANYKTNLVIEDEVPGAQAFEIGGNETVEAISQFAGFEVPEKETVVYEEHMKSGRFLLIADDRDRETGEIYQVFQRHHALNSNYYEDGEFKGEERFYGVQRNADTYYGDQEASMERSSNPKGQDIFSTKNNGF